MGIEIDFFSALEQNCVVKLSKKFLKKN